MTKDPFGWVGEREKELEDKSGYFKIVEGKQTFVLLSHCAPLAQVFDPATKKYRIAQEGDKNVSIKGICWVLQDGIIKQAALPYTIVKSLRSLQQDPEWDFHLPFKHPLTLTAIGAGTKEVEYTLTPSPKQVDIEKAILEELKKKPSPEDIVERKKGHDSSEAAEQEYAKIDYPAAEPQDIDAF